MIPFLKETAQKILESRSNLQDTVIVLPNRRAGLFFSKYLGELVEKPIWMPEVCTIEQLFYSLAGRKPADELSLIFELYELYVQIQPDSESFDRFYFWGELILKDFNDLDQFLAPAEKVYQNLAAIKELESDLSYLTEKQQELILQFWKAFERQKKEEKEKFLKFWQILARLYHDFQHRLKTAGLAYSGQLYREVVENIAAIPEPEKDYIFVGFNAFTLAEEKLIKHFITHFNAQIFWDIDQYYLQDHLQEAGLFFREYLKDGVFGPSFPQEIPDQIRGIQDKIQVHSIPLKINQANLVGKILEGIGTGEPLEETVIILPDEQLLFPMLHSLPPAIETLNVTMGYPIRNAPVYAFLDAVLELQQYTKVDGDRLFFYHKAVTQLLSFPYLHAAEGDMYQKVSESIQEEKLLYVPAEMLLNEHTLSQLIFRKVSASDLLDYVGELTEHLAGCLQGDEVQRSYLYEAFKQLSRLREIFRTHVVAGLKLDFVLKLFRQIFRELKLPFEGEPLQGLQIMGVLESRNLDFKRVIICDVNEGSFPPGGGINSMIPFNLRRAFGLPVQEQNDAIYAYTFYRLLHRSESVHLIYTTSAEQGKAGEMSRFIQQMQVELDVAPSQVAYVPVDMTPSRPIIMKKTPAILEKMQAFIWKEDPEAFVKPLSASGINMYLDCQLKFYLQYIAGLKEKDTVTSEIDPSTFGTILHAAMEYVYQPEEGQEERTIDSHAIDRLLPHIPQAVKQAIRDFYRLEEGEEMNFSGQLLIAEAVINQYLQKLLHFDRRGGVFTVLGVEKKVRARIPIQVKDGTASVALTGYIDRVDRKDGIIRLIDYKTGGDEKKVTSIPSLFDREDSKRNKAAMQTLLYAFFYQAENPSNSLPLKPGIVNMKEIFNPGFNPYLLINKKELGDYREVEGEFIKGLSTVLEEIFDPEGTFAQTENLEKCTYCAFKDICGR